MDTPQNHIPNMAYVVGDIVSAEIPIRGMTAKFYFQVVERLEDGRLIISPISSKETWDQGVYENPWRKFLTSHHGLKIGDGENSQTYQLTKE